MPKLTEEQIKQLEADVQSPAFKDGVLRTADIARKYNLTWKRAKDAINSAQTRLKYQDPNYKALPEVTIPHEQIPNLENTDEEKEVLFVRKQENKPTISLIPPPTPQNTDVLDGNKFYCGTCIRAGKKTILETNMKNCPTCQGVLLWEN